ncbi:MAG: hypothetical protein DYG83_17290 [Candidatus Brocadia sp. AMX2]|uniref:3-isopropylmalate dehydratase large subunit n=2 Tax=Candidatus Brocadiaceae TaxID=1127830 RepID=A0ABQ0JUL4_9BACT|nr:MAG: hypothetical protein EDM70_18300 [Candidatus Brocadia sp. AMX2]KXK25141.1 MAG: hypothetical protein UZ01_03516 [Candidatus Brocadia sinica]MBC6933968.1 hypothetical protein [Candidatus Brocadia sp.]MBL1170201.1 hypothetical protein [Candidatus Brocadia sp. AMX1]NOG41709.1 hypothetical protein [Planctomycetota bacterium]GAN32403.1 3-isopropylmalate dehydratase large subunit [Candidatus Brocadia sinica JPN1]
MLKYVLPCLILFVAPLAVSLAAETKNIPPSIVWEKTLEDAITKAKTMGKPVLLDFFAPT